MRNIFNKSSIITRLTVCMFILIILQSVFFFGSIFASGVVASLYDNAYISLSRTIQNRKSFLESEMNNRWTNFDSNLHGITKIYQEIIGDAERLNDEQINLFLEASVPEVIAMLRATMSTGCFVILNDNDAMQNAHSGLYLKDYDPTTNNDRNSDLYMLKGPVEISRAMQIPLDKSWSYGITLDETHQNLYAKPYQAALAFSNINYLGYWDVSPSFAGNDMAMITYTKPLLDKEGKPFGVIGVELEQTYLYKNLPQAEMNPNSALGYIIAQYDDITRQLTPMISQGALQKNILSANVPMKLTLENEQHEIYTVHDTSVDFPVICHPATIKLYNSNSPFHNERWVLIGLADQNEITRFSDGVSSTLLWTLVLSVLVGIVLAYIISSYFTRPIVQISKNVRNNNPRDVVCLPRTGLSEIDDLSYAIEHLNRNVLESAIKTDKIISMVNLRLGAFEYKIGSGYVTGTSLTFDVLGFDPADCKNQTIAKDVFFAKLKSITQNVEDVQNDVYMLSQQPPKWVKLTTLTRESGVLGVVMDVTQEILDKHALNFERDYDALTRIYNRRAFDREAGEIFKKGNLKVAAFVMLDLDSLKYINDTYGHDTGDFYIKSAAALISQLPKENCIVGRMSGDEFYAFLYGFDTQEEILGLVRGLFDTFEKNSIVLPNGNPFRIRMSGGMAWYGIDSKKFDELIHFADYAMYEGKHTVKGEMRQFNKQSYLSGAFMLSGNEELSKVLDNQLVEFAFQPIIHARTGNIYGYESLMRPQSEILNTPLKLIQIATSQAQLWKIEKITFFKSLSTYLRFASQVGDAKLFINSVPNQVLKPQEYAEIELLYGEILHNIVIEIIENEKLDESGLAFKQALAKKWNAMLALDDYGAGYNSDISLLNISPQIVKIDRLMIEGIQTDKNRQAIVRKLIAYARERDILVLAEGVETQGQLEFLIMVGVDLLQGFYIGRPAFTPCFDNPTLVEQIKHITNYCNDA